MAEIARCPLPMTRTSSVASQVQQAAARDSWLPAVLWRFVSRSPKGRHGNGAIGKPSRDSALDESAPGGKRARAAADHSRIGKQRDQRQVSRRYAPAARPRPVANDTRLPRLLRSRRRVQMLAHCQICPFRGGPTRSRFSNVRRWPGRGRQVAREEVRERRRRFKGSTERYASPSRKCAKSGFRSRRRGTRAGFLLVLKPHQLLRRNPGSTLTV